MPDQPERSERPEQEPSEQSELPAAENAPPFPVPEPEELPGIIEALLFVSDGPVEESQLTRALGITKRQLGAALDRLGEALHAGGIRLQRGPEGVQLVTAPEAAAAVEHFIGIESGRRLTTAALETLAVVAYRQPVTRVAVEAVRGVNSDAAMATLRARGLIEIGGRARGPGRPLLFVTTQRFLEHFGLERPEDLPSLDELTLAEEDEPADDSTVESEGDVDVDGDGNPADEAAVADDAAVDPDDTAEDEPRSEYDSPREAGSEAHSEAHGEVRRPSSATGRRDPAAVRASDGLPARMSALARVTALARRLALPSAGPALPSAQPAPALLVGPRPPRALLPPARP